MEIIKRKEKVHIIAEGFDPADALNPSSGLFDRHIMYNGNSYTLTSVELLRGFRIGDSYRGHVELTYMSSDNALMPADAA